MPQLKQSGYASAFRVDLIAHMNVLISAHTKLPLHHSNLFLLNEYVL